MAVSHTQVGAAAAAIASAYEHITVLIQLVEYMEQRPAPPLTEQQPPPPPTTGQPPAEPGPTTEQQQQQQPAERVRLCIYVIYICNHVVSE